MAAQAGNGKIAFVNNFALFTINADGSGISQLTPIGSAVSDRYSAWSRDGTKLAFARTTVTDKSQIYVMNADGSNQTRLTNNTDLDFDVAWSPPTERDHWLRQGYKHLAPPEQRTTSPNCASKAKNPITQLRLRSKDPPYNAPPEQKAFGRSFRQRSSFGCLDVNAPQMKYGCH